MNDLPQPGAALQSNTVNSLRQLLDQSLSEAALICAAPPGGWLTHAASAPRDLNAPSFTNWMLTNGNPVRESLFCAPGREPQMQRLWNDAQATASAAWQLAASRDGDVYTAALAGLFHRIGAVRVLAVIAAAEQTLGLRAHASLQHVLLTAHQNALRDAVLRDWQLSEPVTAAVRDWPAAADSSEPATLAAVIYIAQVLAAETLYPRFCIARSVAGELSALV